MNKEVSYKQKLLRVKLLGDLPRDFLPSKAHESDSGFDIKAAEDAYLHPMQRVKIRCGFAMALPFGYEATIRPRSGLAAKSGVTVLNTPGTIDADYRGEVCVILINLGDAVVHIEKGARIAQMTLQKVPQGIKVIAADVLPDTERGDGGFGSTGT